MPRKKENPVGEPLPGFDIFGQALAPTDSGVLLKNSYRRKQLAGFVPLWNEFFRCYHHAGVSPNAVYLWAYLRQYEHERREWNAVSDISWPGRRDIAEALGVSISHLPNLLEELRRAGLVTFQPVLPGFEQLAQELNSNIEEVRQRAADFGVTPKIDATLYRTADPYTKTEFATNTGLKFCKACKAQRYCEGVQAAKSAKPNRQIGLAQPNVVAELAAPETERQINVEIDRTQVNTATSIKKKQLPNPRKNSHRITTDSTTESKKEQPPNLVRVKTSINQPTAINQPEITTNQTTSLVVTNPDFDLLLNFGFDQQTAQTLLNAATRHNKLTGYLETILQYSRENARRNPLGLARRLIETGEDRLTRAERWQQQNLFSNLPTVPPTLEQINPDSIGHIPTHSQTVQSAPAESAPDAAWWSTLLQTLQRQHSPVAALLNHSLANRQGRTLQITLRNLVECRRASSYTDVFQRTIADACGDWFELEFVTPS